MELGGPSLLPAQLCETQGPLLFVLCSLVLVLGQTGQGRVKMGTGELWALHLKFMGGDQ